MKKNPFKLLFVLALLFSLSSCSVVEGIFKAGIGVGVFIVIAIIAVIIFIISRFAKKD